jgi:hypothetical protein
MASDLLKLGGLWISKDKNGNEYFSGDYTNVTKLLIYKNTFKKEGSNEPDFNFYAAPKKRKAAEGHSEDSSEEDVPF